MQGVLSFRGKVIRVIIYILLIFLAVVTIYPILYVILGSFKSNMELLLGGANIFPKQFILDNYIEAWEKANFSVYTRNSFIIATGVMFLSLLVSSMAGYVFARSHFKGKDALYNLFLIFMFINVGSIAIRPLFELAAKTHLDSSLTVIIIIATGMGQTTYIFLMTGNIKAIPTEIDEAARIDGCSFFSTFWRVILPIIKPAIATVAILSFRSGWNQYILPNVFTMTNPGLRPLTVGVVLLKSSGDGAAAWNIMFAGSAMSIIPIILVYIIFSKYFISGSTAGAVKG